MAKCRVCHRELHDAAAIAAAIGPTCAARAAARSSVTSTTPAAPAYPAAKMERINRAVTKLARMLAEAHEYRAAAYHLGTPEQQAQGEWHVRLVGGWYGRWRMMQFAVAKRQQQTAWAR